MNDSMKKMINCLLNFPYLVNQLDSFEEIKQRIELLPNSKILLSLFEWLDFLIISTSTFQAVSKTELLYFYKRFPRTHELLVKFGTTDKTYYRKTAKKKFINALSDAENSKVIDNFFSIADEVYERELAKWNEEEEVRRAEFQETEEYLNAKRNEEREKFIQPETAEIDELDNQNKSELEFERDSLLAENEHLKDTIDMEYELRRRDFIDKDRVKSERNSFLVIAGFMVFLAIAYLSVDGFICVGGFGSQCLVV
jgi:hypothetical protein